MLHERQGRYTWLDRLDDFLEALTTLVLGTVDPGERRPGLRIKVVVWTVCGAWLVIGLVVAWGS